MFDLNTERGTISFSENLIKDMIADAVDRTGDRAYLCNYKSKYKKTPAGDYGNIVIDDSRGSFSITVYIVIRFGVSISSVTDTIIDNVYGNMESMLGIRPGSVRVLVTGIESRDIARRELEFIR